MTKEEVFHFAQEAYQEAAVVDIEQLAQAGSDRIYYRIRNGVNRSIIATQSKNLAENERFLSLASYFDTQGLAVPQILAIHPSREVYLQSDAGGKCLLDIVLEKGHTDEVKTLYKKAVTELIKFQLCAKNDAFKDQFDALPSFGYDQILFDLRYFKNNFASKSVVKYNDEKLETEFDALAKTLDIEQSFFMYRDCQGRNIMVDDNEVVFIDFQGGLKGHPLYDVASLLWQAKARLPKDWKQELVESYLISFEKKAGELGVKIDRKAWQQDYEMLTLTRLLQVLGAYGLRGLIEEKEHFISSIPLGLKNIQAWCEQNNLNDYPELENVLAQISQQEFIKIFE